MRDSNCPSYECGKPLNQSLYVRDGGQLLKSCTFCSRVVEEHVFHPIPEYGAWRLPSKEGRPYPQNECSRAYAARASVNFGGVSALSPEEIRALLPDFQPCGELCAVARARGEEPGTGTEAWVEELLEPLRDEVADALAAAGKRPRSVSRAVNRGGVSSPLGRILRGVAPSGASIQQGGRESPSSRSAAPRGRDARDPARGDLGNGGPQAGGGVVKTRVLVRRAGVIVGVAS